jgi:histidine triad (HIT) family protein
MEGKAMNDCIFCKIVAGEIPSKPVYQDEYVYAFHDIDPKAPVHFLVIPREHIPSLDHITPENSAVIAKIYETIARLSKELSLEKGFRVVVNCGEDGGQTVGHIHFHVLAGRALAWPPG